GKRGGVLGQTIGSVRADEREGNPVGRREGAREKKRGRALPQTREIDQARWRKRPTGTRRLCCDHRQGIDTLPPSASPMEEEQTPTPAPVVVLPSASEQSSRCTACGKCGRGSDCLAQQHSRQW
ncbi:unnamed protein product, partial [Ectocarpus sp. 12 AP-2014]